MLHADHELNASTFAARVAAATLTDIHSAIVGGDRRAEGAAARRRQRRRDAAAARDRRRTRRSRRPRRWSARSWRARRRFPGFGHRVYHTEDPRATHLRQMSQRSRPARRRSRSGSRCRSGSRRWSRREKKLNPNVDFYSASTYYALGIADRSVHADLRGQPHVGLDGARARAVREQPPDPPARRVHRPRVSAALSCRSKRGRSRRVPVASSTDHRSAFDPCQWIPAASATSRSSRTSTTASRRWPTASSRSPARCRRARWKRRSSTRWTSSASAASRSRRTRSG